MSTPARVFLLCVLTGCKSTWYADQDGDGYGGILYAESREQPPGYVDNHKDCDDLDPAIHPGASESCNGIDDDCDGMVDEAGAAGALTWCLDADADGYGDPVVCTRSCTSLSASGYVQNAQDCDDTNPLTNPTAVEGCNGIDDDCDGTVDDPDMLTYEVYCRDLDGDSYGDPADCLEACTLPDGYTSDGTDCDDQDPGIHPHVRESCDGVDQDCDGVVDDHPTDGQTWYPDADADGFGADDDSEVFCTQPAGWLEDGGDCDDSEAAVHPGVREICSDGTDNDCDGEEARCWGRDMNIYLPVMTGLFRSQSLGTAIAVLENINNDSRHDFITMQPFAGDSASHTYYDGYTHIGASPSWSITTMWGNPHSLADAGDVDGDGDHDILAGSYDDGTAMLVNVPVGGNDYFLNLAAATFEQEQSFDYAGRDLDGAGDVNDDGYDDIIIGATGADFGGTGAGAAYLVIGPVAGTFSLADSHGRLMGEQAGDSAGGAVSGAGDTNADGLEDVLVGATGVDQWGSSSGAVYLVLGPASGTRDLGAADARIFGEADDEKLGTAVSQGGDVNADGYGDVLVGAPGWCAADGAHGMAYLFLGPVSGDLLGSEADARLPGEVVGDQVGSTVVGPGDMNSDGYDDIVLGASGHDLPGMEDAGAVYVVYGPLTGEMDLAYADGEIAGIEADAHVGSVLDARGHGTSFAKATIAIGVPGYDGGGTTSQGGVWVFEF